MNTGAVDLKKQHRMLVVDDEANIRSMLEETFADRGFSVVTASNGDDAIELLRDHQFEIVLTDLKMPGRDGMDVLRAVKAKAPDTEVMMITAFGTIETAVEAMRRGAADFITKTFTLEEIENKVERLMRRMEAAASARSEHHPIAEFIVGESGATRQLRKMIGRIGPSKSSVLITGPSGTGKELVARAIHEASPRSLKPFVALNCAALAPGILDSELFGHEKGAFTGAAQRRIGRFEKAHTGTLFLDEVGEIDPAIQTKLLRVLQEGEIERVGGNATIQVDVRIVAATNRDLDTAIGQGDFREDFLYRLKVFSLHVEPLCNRRDDIPGLVDHFLNRFGAELGKKIDEVDDAVLGLFMNHDWRGNVRELENVLERAVVLAEGNRITRDELPPELLHASSMADAPAGQPSEAATDPANLSQRTDRLEYELIQGALEKFRWNKTKAAEHLGLKRTTLQYKIRKYGLE